MAGVLYQGVTATGQASPMTTQVDSAINELKAVRTMLCERVQELQQRLEKVSVVRPVSLNKACDSPEKSTYCFVAENLFCEATELRFLHEKVVGMIASLEV